MKTPRITNYLRAQTALDAAHDADAAARAAEDEAADQLGAAQQRLSAARAAARAAHLNHVDAVIEVEAAYSACRVDFLALISAHRDLP